MRKIILKERENDEKYLDKINDLPEEDLDSKLERLPDFDEDELQENLQKELQEQLQTEINLDKDITEKIIEDTQDIKKPVKRKRPEEKENKKIRNKEFARITYLFIGLFLVLMGYLVYFNIFQSKTIINSPYNKRQDIFADRVVRGEILDKDGNVLAKTEVEGDGTEKRIYPYGDLFSHVVGYADKGKSGIESVENYNLLTSNAFIIEKVIKEFKGEKNIGDNVVTTLDMGLQQATYDALGDNKGAVVIMEASTGKILSLVSKPTFDPNYVAVNWQSLNEDLDSAMLNRAMQGKYAPGSTFKIVTALEYMRENPDYPSYYYECTGQIEHDGTVIHCNKNKVHGPEDLKSSFANSCNSSFANIGLRLDIDEYRKTAKQLLFNSKLPSPLMYSESKFQLTKKDPASEIMMTAMGQGKTQVSPYHMALITSAVANGGQLMKPYLVDQIVNYTGTTVTKNMPEKYADLMTNEEAAQLTEYMKEVVNNGTASSLRGRNYTIAGKTGTAEYSTDKDKAHSWFVGFTDVDNPDLVISAVIEGADNTGARAVNVVKKICDSYY